MKKWICLFIALLMVLSLVACGKEEAKQPKPNFNPGPDDTEENNTSEPPEYVGVRSLEELETMREMIKSTDEKALASYLISVEGGGADSVADLETFLNLYDTLPKFSLMDGEISWIAKYDDVICITTKNENGNGCLVEYHYANKGKTVNFETYGNVLPEPLVSADKKVTIYTEKQTVLEEGKGVSVRMWGMLEDMTIFIKYVDRNNNSVDATALISSLTVKDPAK